MSSGHFYQSPERLTNRDLAGCRPFVDALGLDLSMNLDPR